MDLKWAEGAPILQCERQGEANNVDDYDDSVKSIATNITKICGRIFDIHERYNNIS